MKTLVDTAAYTLFLNKPDHADSKQLKVMQCSKYRTSVTHIGFISKYLLQTIRTKQKSVFPFGR